MRYFWRQMGTSTQHGARSLASKFHWVFFGLCYVLVATYSQAQEASLFSGRVQVPRQDIASRTLGEREAFAQMLVKISGLPDIVNHSSVAQALDQPSDFITRFGFSRKAVPGEIGLKLFLEVSFDSTSVLKLLRTAALPVWDADRPRVVAWIGVDDVNGRRLLDASSTDDAAGFLLDQADVRGVPLFLPLMDLLDREYVDTSVVFDSTAARSTLLSASERYSSGGMLVMRLTENLDGQWSVDWEFWWDGEQLREVSDNLTMEQAVRIGVDWVTDRLVGQYAVVTQAPEVGANAVHWVQVNRVRSLATYQAVLGFFEGIGIVSDVHLARVENEALLLGVWGASSREQLLQLIRLNRRLKELPTSDSLVIRLNWTG